MAAGLLAVTAACGDAATDGAPRTVSTPIIGSPPESAETPITSPSALVQIVQIDEFDFPVELAVNSAKRTRGLSGRASLDAGTGMLFIFEDPERFSFWMREMEFSLDILWISAGCRVVDISPNVPAPEPGTSLNDLPRYSPETPALYVLEINGGESEARGLGVGDRVEFLGGLAGEYGC